MDKVIQFIGDPDEQLGNLCTYFYRLGLDQGYRTGLGDPHNEDILDRTQRVHYWADYIQQIHVVPHAIRDGLVQLETVGCRFKDMDTP